MNFFVVSAGKPGSDYIEENFDDIIASNEFAMHPQTQQKGTYYSIDKNDVLILKYERKFVAYGIVKTSTEDSSKEFSLRIKVDEWIFFDSDNKRNGVSRYGLQNATIGGGNQATVKTIRPNFGLDKIKEINSSHPTFDWVQQRYKESESNLEKEGDYFELHEELFNYLLEKTESDPELTFVVRSSNNKGKLDEGYWFFGEETVAISFWTGMDYPNDRPAISLLINPNLPCQLIIKTEVYKEFRNFLKTEDLVELVLGLEEDKENKSFIKPYKYPLTEYLKCLEYFLKNDFHTINRLVEKYNETVPNSEFEEGILRFPIQEFNKRLNNIFRFRQSESPDITIYSLEDEKKADSLEVISIEDYGLIRHEELTLGNSNWVFITGENGSGKTMLLRAIGTALGNRALNKVELEGKYFNVNAQLSSLNRTIEFKRVRNDNIKARRAIVSRGLAMYGPYRLQQASGQIKDETFKKALSKRGSFESLFEDGSKLLSIDKQLELWYKGNNKNIDFDSRIKQIKSLLPKLIPDLVSLRYRRNRNGKFSIDYLISTKGSEELMPLKWNDLSSGNKNILNLVSDIIIRLFHQQPKISDPSELRGIVLIDEIDLHLHPKAQRDLVTTLSETFPLIQFIVTTHSPIPLLGAPQSSAIFVAKRDWERGVYVERLRKLENEFKYLLPNTLLTSDIFDFDIMEDIPRDQISKVFLEDDYDDIEKNKAIDQRLASLDKSIFPDDLFI